MACNGCRYNVSEYIDADPRDVKLFMFEAENRAAIIRYNSGPPWVLIIFVLIFFGILVAGSVITAHKNKTYLAAHRTAAPIAVSSSDPVWDILRLTANDITKKKDVNGDGKINCIDAAVTFYKYYPNKSEVTIETNYNTATGMNHAFNCIKINGVWRAIEPQTVWHNRTSYWMRDFWGSTYNSSFNKDETEKYKVYAK
jgi:hypothetical protein